VVAAIAVVMAIRRAGAGLSLTDCIGCLGERVTLAFERLMGLVLARIAVELLAARRAQRSWRTLQ